MQAKEQEQEKGVTQKNAPFFSIIMPVYNTQAYIARALDCICKQSFTDWELLVINDDSPDSSAEIALKFAQEDARICVLTHTRNAGLSAARNTGLSRARGRYVWMPDSDDTFETDLLGHAHAALVSCESDVLMFGHEEKYFDEQGKFLYSHEMALDEKNFESPNTWHNCVIDFEAGTHYGYAWNKIYKRERIEELKLRFEHVRLIEDITFNVDFFQDAHSLFVMSGMPYKYAKRKGSSLTNANAYSAQVYWQLHKRRIEMLCGQLKSWDVFDEHAQGILGALLGRYVLSALVRSFDLSENLSRNERHDICKKLLDEPLCQELLRCAHAHSSTLRLCVGVLKTRKCGICLFMARLIHFVQGRAYKRFTHARSKR